jgi:Kef-type K+ transport system membrane component KefB/mannitol/fructose-specific phosphotransferase system IIA component (Ntr-type)
MVTLNHHEVIILLIQLSILLIFARIFGELSRLAKQPAVIGEIIAGIVIGPSFLGNYFSDTFNYIFKSSQNAFFALDGISSIGVILLLFVAGMELEIPLIVKKGKAAAIISLFGVIIPFIIGFSSGYYFYESVIQFLPEYKLLFSLFFGTALSISALPVIAKTLLDLNLLKTQIGGLILASAMVDDLIGWIFFSILLSMIVTSSGLSQIVLVIISVLVFVAITLTLGRAIINIILSLIVIYISGPSGVIAFSILICLLGSLFTQSIGIHSIFGAFIVGIAVGNSEHFTNEHREIIHQFTAGFFAPLFFVMIGLKVNFIQNFDLFLVLFVVFFAFAAKIIGVGIGSYYFAKLNKYESWAIAFGLNARGSMAIILGLIALDAKVINQEIFVAIVIMAILTSITSGPFLNYFVKFLRNRSFLDLLDKSSVYFTEAENKNDLLKEICNFAANNYNLNEKELHLEVLRREQLLSTGLQNHLAIPHAKFSVSSPYVVIAISKRGIEFDSIDGLPAKVIVFLITPVGENDLQLNLLAEIASKLGKPNVIDKIVSMNTNQEIINLLTKI